METVVDGRLQPLPTAAAMAARPAPQHVPSSNGDGYAPGLLHANGQGGADPSAHASSSSRDGWDR
jgi:hypothetical protein